MKTTVTIPSSTEDITIRQFQRYLDLLSREDLSELETQKRKIEIFTSLTYREINMLNASDYIELISLIDLALNIGAKFKNRFLINGTEFGFIPNLDKITLMEWAALDEIGTDPKRFHELMSVLFRPVKKTDNLGNYKIVSYEVGKFDEIMKDTPMSVVNGALVFFCHLGTELLRETPKYTKEEQMKVAMP